jgi:hypothetical protein
MNEPRVDQDTGIRCGGEGARLDHYIWRATTKTAGEPLLLRFYSGSYSTSYQRRRRPKHPVNLYLRLYIWNVTPGGAYRA